MGDSIGYLSSQQQLIASCDLLHDSAFRPRHRPPDKAAFSTFRLITSYDSHRWQGCRKWTQAFSFTFLVFRAGSSAVPRSESSSRKQSIVREASHSSEPAPGAMVDVLWACGRCRCQRLEAWSRTLGGRSIPADASYWRRSEPVSGPTWGPLVHLAPHMSGHISPSVPTPPLSRRTNLDIEG